MRAILTTIFWIGITTAAVAQQLSDAEVNAAIAAGQNKKFDHLIASCSAHADFATVFNGNMAGGVQPTGAYQVTIATPSGQIAYLAASAKRLYKKFGIADVTEDMRAPGLVVLAEPNAPSRDNKTTTIASPLEALVLKSKIKPDAVAQPTGLMTEPVEWTNLVGGKVNGTRGTAHFELGDVKALPTGDFDVVLVTQAGERRCKVGANDRAKLLR